MKWTTKIARKRSTRSLLTACVLLAVSSTAMAQVAPAAQEDAINAVARGEAAGANVPLRQLTLYSSGVGFFEHAGPVPEASTSAETIHSRLIPIAPLPVIPARKYRPRASAKPAFYTVPPAGNTVARPSPASLSSDTASSV